MKDNDHDFAVFRHANSNIYQTLLDSARQKWLLIAETSGIGFWCFDFSTQKIVWDENTRLILGDGQRTETTDVRDIKPKVHPDDLRPLLQGLMKMKKSNNGLTVDFRFFRPDGSVRHVKIHGLPDRGPSGRTTRLVGISVDITEYIQAEKEYARLQTQLLQVNKMEAMGKLTAGIAHDFNNMLSVIIGSLDLARPCDDPACPLLRQLGTIRKAAEKSAALTRQLLAYSRQQSGEPRLLDINQSVEKSLSLLKTILTRGVELSWHPAQDLPSVKMDPSQLDQIVTNLCVNSRDAIADTGRISVKTQSVFLDPDYCSRHAGACPGQYVLLTVSDNGCGIEPGVLKKSFEPFFTTKEPGKGTGLGLSTVYGIVKQNKGYITVNSELQIGTSVRVYLPCHAKQKPHPLRQEPPVVITMGQETILLVEDEPLIMSVACTMLRHLGYTVLEAAKPSDAFRLAQEHAGRIQLVLCDAVLPEMSGDKLVKTIVSSQPALKFMFMSGYPTQAISEYRLLDEQVPFIEKPFSLEHLAQKVRSVLDN